MTHLHSNDGLLASSIGSGRWMGDKEPCAPAPAAPADARVPVSRLPCGCREQAGAMEAMGERPRVLRTCGPR
jgi:hypothetical protein